jgi:hypothetical protein
LRDLADDGKAYNRKTVAASQRRQRLRAKAAKKFKATTNSKHSLKEADPALRWQTQFGDDGLEIVAAGAQSVQPDHRGCDLIGGVKF